MKHLTFVLSFAVALASAATAQSIQILPPVNGQYLLGGWDFENNTNNTPFPVPTTSNIGAMLGQLPATSVANAYRPTLNATHLIGAADELDLGGFTIVAGDYGFHEIYATGGGNAPALGTYLYNVGFEAETPENNGALKIQGNVDNKYLDFSFSANVEGAGSFSGLSFSLQTKADTADFRMAQELWMSVDGGEFTLVGTHSPTAAWTSASFALPELADQANNVTLRYTFNTSYFNDAGFDFSNSLLLDNIAINFTTLSDYVPQVPEAAGMPLIFGAAALGLAALRRRQA